MKENIEVVKTGVPIIDMIPVEGIVKTKREITNIPEVEEKFRIPLEEELVEWEPIEKKEKMNDND